MKNIGLKLLSISIALLLYFFVHSQTNSSVIALVVPIELRGLPKNKMVLLPSLRQAQVTIKGPSFLVREVAISSPAFRVVLPPEVGDRYDVSLTGDDLTLPPSVEVVSIEPPGLELIFDSVIDKELTVEVPRIGKLSENLKLISVDLKPEKVLVRGPQTELSNLDTIQSFPLDMRSIAKDSEINLALRPPGKYSKSQLEAVTADIKVVSVAMEKTFFDVPVEVRVINGYSYEVLPNLVNVEVSGPRSTIESLKVEDVRPYVRVDEGVLKSNKIEVLVEAPSNIEVVQVQPKKVGLMLKQVGTATNSKKK